MSKAIGFYVLPGNRRLQIRLDTENSASHYGIGVLLVPRFGQDWILDGAVFRAQRDFFGNHIQANRGKREAICHALGVPTDEPGIQD
ncbi:MAG: hypothetical protein Q7O66_16770 [Dehalococcoidia bacterium]|nr:hypothetical protein [Dehalococcoidia bacterium]